MPLNWTIDPLPSAADRTYFVSFWWTDVVTGRHGYGHTVAKVSGPPRTTEHLDAMADQIHREESLSVDANVVILNLIRLDA